jgi:hypothetical protein
MPTAAAAVAWTFALAPGEYVPEVERGTAIGPSTDANGGGNNMGTIDSGGTAPSA